MAIPLSTLQYHPAQLSSEEPGVSPENAEPEASSPPPAKARNPHGFFGRPHTRRGAIARSKRRRYPRGKLLVLG